MFFVMPHLIEAAVVMAFIFGLWQLLKNRKKLCCALSLLVIWCSVFSSYLALEIIPDPMEHVTVTATGEKNPQATVNEICLLGFNANGSWYNLSPPVEGNWAWFPGQEGADYFYAGWFPGAEGLQPENATDSIVIEIYPGQSRSLVFLTNEWYGIAEVSFAGETQIVDTFGHGELKEVYLTDSSPAYYHNVRIQRLPVVLTLHMVIGLATLLFGVFVSSSNRITKINKHQFLFEELVKRDFSIRELFWECSGACYHHCVRFQSCGLFLKTFLGIILIILEFICLLGNWCSIFLVTQQHRE